MSTREKLRVFFIKIAIAEFGGATFVTGVQKMAKYAYRMTDYVETIKLTAMEHAYARGIYMASVTLMVMKYMHRLGIYVQADWMFVYLAAWEMQEMPEAHPIVNNSEKLRRRMVKSAEDILMELLSVARATAGLRVAETARGPVIMKRPAWLCLHRS